MFKRLLPVLLALCVPLFIASPAMAEFGLEKFAVGVQNGEGQNGTPDLQAGSHPYALTTTFVLKAPPSCPKQPGGIIYLCLQEGLLKDVRFELPPGFVGDPTATPRCGYQEFAHKGCSGETVVGLATTYLGEELRGNPTPQYASPDTVPVYNLVPPPGVVAEFGYIVDGKVPVLLQTGVRAGGDYGLTTTVSNINQAQLVYASKVTIWGVPASPAHNSLRGGCQEFLGAGSRELDEVGVGLLAGEAELEGPIYPAGTESGLPESTGGNCPSNAPQLPLLTNPTSCGVSRTATLSVDDWEEPGNFSGERTKSATLPPLSGCEKLDFSPTVTVKPDVPDASSSSGLTVNIKVPQETALNPVGLTEADVKDATFVLPPGVALNPADANGLEACSSNPSALAVNQLGSPGDGIGYLGVKPLGQPGVEGLAFTPSLPGSIASNNGVSTGALGAGENLLQPGLNFCANGSKVAEVKIKTPLLEGELEGAIYLAAQEANPYGSVFAQYLVAEEEKTGVLVKLPGEITLCKNVGEDPLDAAGEPIPGVTCEAVGQVVGTFLNTPQAPVEDIKVHYFGGEKAPLTTPAHCGTYTMRQSFVPWNGAPTAHPTAPFTITNGPNGGPGGGACPSSSLPFSPTLRGAALNINAGAFSPFTATMIRADGEQNLQSLEVHLPPGLSGILSNVELCPEPQANLGECGPNSLIGETTVSVGVGGDPYTVTGGKFYLTGPYNGTGSCNTPGVAGTGCAPFGITFEVPAKAGPFDLANTQHNKPPCDCILVRGKIEINPLTAAITITSNPPGTTDSIPTSIEGIPLEIQDVNATTTRGNFQFNPTNCNKMEVSGTIHSSENGTDSIAVPFQVTNCEHLKFDPSISFSTSGKTSKADGADLITKVSYPPGPQGTYADIAKVKVELPKQLPSRLTTLQKACTDAQFEANPAACPAASKIGYAVVHTPLIPVPLEGPAIFVSHGGEAFPSLTMVLQGYGVTIDLVGTTFISKSGITSTTFKTVPDQPFSTFELTLPEGPYSALGTNYDLCTQNLKMPNELVGQNGAEIKQSATIAVSGCSGSISVVSAKVNRRTLTLSVYAPAAGKLTASGKGLSNGVKTYSGREALTFTLKQKKGGKLRTRVSLKFTPRKGKGQSKTVKVSFKK
jgi:hypothetical protein